MKKSILKKLWLWLWLFFNITIVCNSYPLEKKILIEVDISTTKTKRISGPFAFIKAINQVLPYTNSNCSFIASKKIQPLKKKKRQPDYYYISLPRFGEKEFHQWTKKNKTKQLILGPNFVPSNWQKFPQPTLWKEKNFPEILNSVKGVVVHADRVKNHLAEKSNTTSLLHKFINVRACTNLKPHPNDQLKSFKDRTIDIIFFEKYADVDRSKQGQELFERLTQTQELNIVRLVYGNYTRDQLIEWAKDAKFVIYFSFYDTGAIGLKEIQNFGVMAFTLQEDLILDSTTSFYVPELALEATQKPAYDKIMEKIALMNNNPPDTEFIAKINQNNNQCEKALDDLCQGIL